MEGGWCELEADWGCNSGVQWAEAWVRAQDAPVLVAALLDPPSPLGLILPRSGKEPRDPAGLPDPGSGVGSGDRACGIVPSAGSVWGEVGGVLPNHGVLRGGSFYGDLPRLSSGGTDSPPGQDEGVGRAASLQEAPRTCLTDVTQLQR